MYTDWYIVATILTLAARIADQAAQAAGGVDTVRAQTTSLEDGVDKVNDSAVRILHMARTLRKVAVGK
jgi:X-X-X-Leu-X-X-Gly heptad repeat protein